MIVVEHVQGPRDSGHGGSVEPHRLQSESRTIEGRVLRGKREKARTGGDGDDRPGRSCRSDSAGSPSATDPLYRFPMNVSASAAAL